MTVEYYVFRALRVEKGCGALRMMKEFHPRQWKRSTSNDFIKKIDVTGSADRKRGTGRPRSVRKSDNIAVVDELICRQGQPGSGKSPREISRETGISPRSVQHIVKHVLL